MLSFLDSSPSNISTVSFFIFKIVLRKDLHKNHMGTHTHTHTHSLSPYTHMHTHTRIYLEYNRYLLGLIK